MPSKKLLKIGLLLLLIVTPIYFLARMLTTKPTDLNAQDNPQTEQPQLAEAVASTQINSTFQLPVKDEAGSELGQMTVEIVSAEKRNEIYVKGQKATAVAGRKFLIINMKIDNPVQGSFDLKTRNYVRLSVNGNEQEWLAPDIHNDPVEIQAISTKLTRVGFPINSNDTQLKLQIGEIKGDKQYLLLEI
jgi:hypothetical protein